MRGRMGVFGRAGTSERVLIVEIPAGQAKRIHVGGIDEWSANMQQAVVVQGMR